MTAATEWTDHAKQQFVERLAATGNVTEAARSVGRSRSGAYRVKDNDEAFSEAWDEAVGIATDALEAEARRRAVEGVQEPVFYQGAVCGHVVRYSDRMLELLLRGHRPEVFRDRQSVEHSGKDGGPIDVRHSDARDKLAHLIARQTAGSDAAGDPSEADGSGS